MQHEEPDKQRTHREKGGGFAPGNPWRFPPGQSGNPAGRPRNTKFLSDRLRERVEDKAGELADRILDRLLALAEKDDSTALGAINAIFDRLEGKPRQVEETQEAPHDAEDMREARRQMMRDAQFHDRPQEEGDDGDA